MDEMSRSEAGKIWENLTIADNFIFQKVMRKKRLCKRLIEKILRIKIRKIMFPETEKGSTSAATASLANKRPLRGHYAHALT